MKRMILKRLNQSGQSAVEFMIITVVIFFFLLFYMSLSFALVASEYVDYATFMAARTYKSASFSKETQEQLARDVFQQYLNPIDSVIRAPRVRFTPNGAQSSYQVDLFYLPPLFVKSGTAPSRITLQSESLLGRDPSNRECQEFFSSFADQFGVGQTFFANLMEDNGC